MPKLTLRDLFAAVTIVALVLGWWLDRSRLARKSEKATRENVGLREEIEALKWIKPRIEAMKASETR
jgi:hypothetical protein